jgi:hypothetical protein
MMMVVMLKGMYGLSPRSRAYRCRSLNRASGFHGLKVPTASGLGRSVACEVVERGEEDGTYVELRVSPRESGAAVHSGHRA